jgi:hypothetical protein
MALENVEFFPVESSNVAEIGYDGNDQELWVRFANGALYVYQNVPPDIWDQFVNAPSMGKFIHTHMKNRYPYSRVG